ncbi:hypothetical protein Hanom_Chr07g00654031 [Helianthus anomalus]
MINVVPAFLDVNEAYLAVVQRCAPHMHISYTKLNTRFKRTETSFEAFSLRLTRRKP